MKGMMAVLAAMLAPTLALAGEAELNSRDFAYGFLLEATDKGAVYSLEIPEEVYRTVNQSELEDIRVFNGAGEVVPHLIRPPEGGKEESRQLADVPIFPLTASKEGGADTVSLSVRRNTDGTIIDIDSGRSGAEQGKIAGYLLDLGEQSENVGSLEFFWTADSAHASSTVQVQQSADLQSWQTMVPRVTLVDLQYAGNRVEQRKVALQTLPQRYLKVTWLAQQPPLELTRVAAESRVRSTSRPLQWVSLYNGEKGQDGDRTAISYDGAFRLPVQQARVQFPEVNSVVSGIIESRQGPDSPWRERCRAVFYLLERGGEQLQSEPCRFGASSDRQWRLVVVDDGAGLANSARSLTLALGWQSDELLFLARGTGPYLLAFGSGRPGAAVRQNPAMMLATIGQQGGDIVHPAVIGKRIELGGPKVLEVPPPPKPWKTWLLWGVLAAGVLGMSVMAVRLVRDMRRDEQ